MTTRRNFIKTLGRTLAAGGLAGMGGYLLLKDTSGQVCDFNFPCNNCGRLSSCNDQKARDYKDAGQKGDKG